jgi:hypothetical protein
VLHRVGAVRVPCRPCPSSSDIARGRPMLVHGASAFGGEEDERRAYSFKTVQSFPASGNDPTPIVRAPSISRGAATMSDVVRGPCEEDAGRKPCPERGSHGRRTTVQLLARSHWPCTAERSRPCSIGIGRRSGPLLGTGFSPRGLFTPVLDVRSSSKPRRSFDEGTLRLRAAARRRAASNARRPLRCFPR